MRQTITALLSTIVALWTIVIAVIAMQNAEPVSLKFLGLESIPMPFGFVFALMVAIGMVGTALLWPWWTSGPWLPKAWNTSKKSRRSP
ncbi:DUF1049 domain-containing protein [Alkalinema sp. FACHB-956]|uniref:DUF1049 domain-containing protein n=1 Tax=Alkalinema sp. FACHB-956 TaxID=2692768 RepID=UPI0016868023|nr:DUF1049 domain-containing protein [Alkalinema sp. FACHB-956]MBD2327368.1 DUF1049 domain-containing protein [Alkalinema sp. FACHB-956]